MHPLLSLTAALALLFAASAGAQTESTTPTMSTATKRAEALAAFQAKKKFIAEGLYPGATNEQDRARYEVLVNDLAARLLNLPPEKQTKANVLSEFKVTMPAFELVDSEERDRFLDYLNELMSIFSIESSDGLLNTWRYGFDPKESIEKSNQRALASMSAGDLALLAKLESATSSTIELRLKEILGEPQTAVGPLRVWHLNAQGTSAISLFKEGEALVLLFMTPAGHLYRRRM
jgi:hypothetical protein